jgi:hypothetical protein
VLRNLPGTDDVDKLTMSARQMAPAKWPASSSDPEVDYGSPLKWPAASKGEWATKGSTIPPRPRDPILLLRRSLLVRLNLLLVVNLKFIPLLFTECNCLLKCVILGTFENDDRRVHVQGE